MSDWFGIDIENNSNITIVGENQFLEDNFGRQIHFSVNGKGKWVSVKEKVSGFEQVFPGALNADISVKVSRGNGTVGEFTVRVIRDQSNPVVSIYKRLINDGVALYYVLPGQGLVHFANVPIKEWN